MGNFIFFILHGCFVSLFKYIFFQFFNFYGKNLVVFIFHGFYTYIFILFCFMLKFQIHLKVKKKVNRSICEFHGQKSII